VQAKCLVQKRPKKLGITHPAFCQVGAESAEEALVPSEVVEEVGERCRGGVAAGYDYQACVAVEPSGASFLLLGLGLRLGWGLSLPEEGWK